MYIGSILGLVVSVRFEYARSYFYDTPNWIWKTYGFITLSWNWLMEVKQVLQYIICCFNPGKPDDLDMWVKGHELRQMGTTPRLLDDRVIT